MIINKTVIVDKNKCDFDFDFDFDFSWLGCFPTNGACDSDRLVSAFFFTESTISASLGLENLSQVVFDRC